MPGAAYPLKQLWPGAKRKVSRCCAWLLRMDAEIARLRATLEQAVIDREEAWQRIDVVRRVFDSQAF
jgi:hypothetical protein